MSINEYSEKISSGMSNVRWKTCLLSAKDLIKKCWKVFYSNCNVTAELGKFGGNVGLADQRVNQSGFSFELEELSTKFASIKEPKKKV
jgi:hypothetical protein